MTLFFQTVFVAFSLFSALPVPVFEWNEKNMRFAFLPLPLIGGVIGGFTALWAFIAARLGLPVLLTAAGACVLPAAVTGGFHLDGFTDTCDALASHASPERKREILKDSHIGAFAAIRLAEYFVLCLGLFAALPFTGTNLALWTLALMLSRAAGSLSICTLPLSEGSSLARSFVSAADKKLTCRFLGLWCLLLAVAMAAVGGAAGIGAVLINLPLFAYFKRMARTQFEGVSGDLGGWFICVSELMMLAVLVLFAYLPL